MTLDDELRDNVEYLHALERKKLNGKDRKRGLSFTLYRDIEAEPRKDWLANDYLGAGELSCIFGPPLRANRF